MTERDDRSTLEDTGRGGEFSRLVRFLASEPSLPVLTLRDHSFTDRSEIAAAGWAASGAMWLTGHPAAAPLAPAGAVVPAVGAAVRVAGALAGSLGGSGVLAGWAGGGSGPAGSAGWSAGGSGAGGGFPAPAVAALLTGRAALRGLRRQGRTSANGSCRLLRAADGWVAVNLARPTDVDAVPALIETPVPDGDPWPALAAAVAAMPARALVERATLLALPAAALPAAALPAAAVPARGPFGVRRAGPAAEPGRIAGDLLVVDLSAMWAGPVCAQLLGWAGMRVVKVESTSRPDGARGGDERFFDWLHSGHESVALDLGTEGGRRALRALVARADVVIEASRPRALAQLGIDADAVVAARPGVTWVGITGHGRGGAGAERVAFGDDAAVAAGLVARDAAGEPVFCGDAIADPVTGLLAAVGALASAAAGGGHLLDVSMVGAVRFAAGTPAAPVAAVPAGPGAWALPPAPGRPPQPVVRPAAPPPPPSPARPLGADTAAVVAELLPGTGGDPGDPGGPGDAGGRGDRRPAPNGRAGGRPC